MVFPREQFIGAITELDENHGGIIICNDAVIKEVIGYQGTARLTKPVSGSSGIGIFWVEDPGGGNPTQAKFTNSNNVTVTLGQNLVTSVFGRTGTVTANSTDIINSSNVSGTTVTDAMNNILSEFDNISLAEVLSIGNQTSGYNINLNNNSYLYSSDGYVRINDILDMATHIITNVSTPVSESDAVNKGYVDDLVIGYPASSTDNAIVRWDGTTGRIIQDSSTTIDDSGVLTLPGTGSVNVLNTTSVPVTLLDMTNNVIIVGDLEDNIGMAIRSGDEISFYSQGSAISKMSLSTVLSLGVHVSGNGYSILNVGYTGLGPSTSDYGYGHRYQSTEITTYLNNAAYQAEKLNWHIEHPRTPSNTLSVITSDIPTYGILKYCEASVETIITNYNAVTYQSNTNYSYS
jgi:hypothetical protein